MELIRLVTQIIDSKPRETEDIILPIEKINELPVTVKISITPAIEKYLFFIDVDCHEIDMEDDESSLNLLTKFFYEIDIINPVINTDEFLNTFKRIINGLYFDRVNGTIDDEQQDTKFFQEIITNPNISFATVDNCSVCMEETKTKSLCGHTLCLICWSKIKSIEGIKQCPICRENLFYGRT
jgi:hypothetical protein